MKTIDEHVLFEVSAESYYGLALSDPIELRLPVNAYVLSVMSERSGDAISIKAFIVQDSSESPVRKLIKLVTTNPPEESGWCFINSVLVSTGPEANPLNIVHHAYVKIC